MPFIFILRVRQDQARVSPRSHPWLLCASYLLHFTEVEIKESPVPKVTEGESGRARTHTWSAGLSTIRLSYERAFQEISLGFSEATRNVWGLSLPGQHLLKHPPNQKQS